MVDEGAGLPSPTVACVHEKVLPKPLTSTEGTTGYETRDEDQVRHIAEHIPNTSLIY